MNSTSKDPDTDPTPQVISDILMLAGALVPPEVVATWTDSAREAAIGWAGSLHLHASDNFDVELVRKPEFVTRAEEICASPAQAQLAVEAWAARTSDGDFMMGVPAMARMAQDAITGLTVLMLRETRAK